MANINAGDVVQLKSGGPLMTVESIGDYMDGTKAKCVWFESSTRMEGLFTLPMLVKEDDGETN